MLSLVWQYFWSYKQITSAGWNVKAWAKWYPVVYAMWWEDELNQNKKKFLWHRYYNVFDIEKDTEWLEDVMASLTPGNSDFNVLQELIDYHKQNNIAIEIGEPAYSPMRDVIYMPPKEKFFTWDDYNATLAHESVHSTWHESRLNRLQTDHVFGSPGYAQEELVAEIWAMLLTGNRLSDNSIAYIRWWLSKVGTAWAPSKEEIYKAFSKAQTACDFILNIHHSDEE